MKRMNRFAVWMLIVFLIAGNLQTPVFAAMTEETAPEANGIEAEAFGESAEGDANSEELVPEGEAGTFGTEETAPEAEAADPDAGETAPEAEAADPDAGEAAPEAEAADTEEVPADVEEEAAAAEGDVSDPGISAEMQEEEVEEESLKEEVSEERMLAAEDHENDFESAVEIEVGNPVQAGVTEENPYAFFRFVPEEDGNYQIYTTSGNDTYGRLYEEHGEGEGQFSEIDADDDSGEGNNFMITRYLTGGSTYWARVNEYSLGAMEFTFSVERRNLIVNGPEEQTFNVFEGEESTFSVDAQSEEEITYTWYEQSADSDEKNELENENGASLSVTAAFPEQDTVRFYYCRITAGGEEAWRSFILQKVSLHAWIEGYDQDQTSIWLNVGEGESATFTAAAETADGSSPSFEWFQYQGEEEEKVILGTEASYTTEALTENQSFYCRVAAEDGTEVFLSVSLEVDTNQEYSELNVWPEGYPYETWQNVNILGCDSVTLSVYAENSLGHEVRYQWFKESRPDPDTAWEDAWNEIAGAAEKDYVVEAPTCLDRFRCVVTDADQNEGYAGFEFYAENNFYITRDFGQDGYDIEDNAQDVSGLDSITLHLETYAEDYDGITYQWYRQDGEDAVELEGETGDSLTVQEPQNGASYFCRAKDKYGNSSTVWCYFRQNNNLYVYVGYDAYENREASITLDPRSEATHTLTPYVEADDREGLRYAWSMSDEDGVHEGIGTEESLYIDHQPQSGTTYSCEVTDRFGNSGTAEYYFLEDIGLEVYPKEGSAGHPSASYAVAGLEEITLNAVVHVEKGKEVTYSWSTDSSEDRDLGEEHGTLQESCELTLKVPSPVPEETFYCQVSDGRGNSGTAEFRFVESVPRMAARPAGAEEGEDTVTVEFDPDEPTMFHMDVDYEGEADESSILFTWKNENGDELESGYGNDSYYGRESGDFTDGERVSCTLTDSFGQSTTVYFVVSVKVKIAAGPEQTFFRDWVPYGETCWSGDARISFTPGQEITLKTLAETRPAREITYAWYASEEEDPVDWGEPLAGETDSTLQVQDPSKNYRCVAAVAGKDVSAHATFYLEAENHLFVYPEGNRKREVSTDIYAEAGKPVTLKAIVQADDSTDLTYKWFKLTETGEEESDYIPVDGASDSLVTEPLTKQTEYCCEVEDRYGNSKSAYFIIYLNQLDVYPVGRTTDFRDWDIEAAPGETVTLRAQVVTSDSGTSVTWNYRDPETWDSLPVEGAYDSASSTAELVLDKISASGMYECQVKDSYGNQKKATFDIHVNHFRAWPAGDPDSFVARLRAAAGNDVTLRFAAQGDDLSKMTCLWEKVEQIWDEDAWEYQENVQTAGSDRDLVLQGVTEDASYRCTVSDGYGNREEISFHLSVDDIVAEADSPSEFSVRPGESVTLKVKAEAGPDVENLTYMWEADGKVLMGKTSDTLTITPEKSGSYTCCIMDGSDHEARVYFQVEVNHLRAWQKGAAEHDAYVILYVDKGEEARLETDFDADDRDVSFSWKKGYEETEEIEGADSDSLTTEPVTDTILYECTVHDKYGNEKTVSYRIYVDGKYLAVRPEGCEEGKNKIILDAEEGKPVSLKVVLDNKKEGETCFYRWIDDSDAGRKIIYGADTDTLVVPKASANDRYICQVSNEEGYGQDTEEAEFVIRTNHFRAVAAVGQKDDSWGDSVWKVTAYPGSEVTLKVSVTADDRSGLTYEWLDDGDAQQRIFTDTPDRCQVTAPEKEEDELWGEDIWNAYYCYIIDQYGNNERITFHVFADRSAPNIKGIKEEDVVIDLPSEGGPVYDGKAKEPAVTVTVDDKILEAGTDYEVSYSGNVNAGENTAKVTVTGKGNYEGDVEKTFSIAKAAQKPQAEDLTVTVSGSGKISLTGAEGGVRYTSSDPAVVAVDDDGTVTGKKAGTAKITVRAEETDNYLAAETELTVTVKKIKLAAADVSLAQDTFTYNGKNRTPAVTVKKGGRELTADTDYTAAYADNLNAGTAKVTVTGKGDYTGTVEKTFTIAKAAQKLTVKAAKTAICVGQATTISVSGARGTKTFKSNSSAATVNSAGKVNAKKVGTVKITVSAAAAANYKAGSATVTIKILPAATKKLTAANQAKGLKLTWQKVAGANGYIIYRNNKKAKTISKGATVTWADTATNTNGAKYTYKVVAKASTGTSTLSKSLTTYRVAAPAVKSLKNTASKKATVTWGKNAKATGYEIQYSLKKNFSGAKTVKITKAATVSKAIANLTKGKTWYFRIRTFKKVGKTTYNSAWSGAKTVKITK